MNRKKIFKMKQIHSKKLMNNDSPSRQKLSMPSTPSSMAREFIREYYNLLNQSPVHLHLLYSKNASLMHNDSILVKGQSEIHKKIMELNFIDSFAKIKSMEVYSICDSGQILGQVCGELLNDRRVTRRFLQSMVLEPTCSNKYHILNDIFRYLDKSTWLCDHDDAQRTTDKMESLKEENQEGIESSSVTYAMIVKGNMTSPIPAEQSICHLTSERYYGKEIHSPRSQGNYFMDLFDTESLYLSRSEGSYFDSRKNNIHF
nr:ras GTPase-activating protein-binding protein 1-like [Lepeophtheirus salmonis]